jgi:hypothetical protein
MSAWTDASDKGAPTNRAILVVATLKRDNDSVTREQQYLFLAKWDERNKEFRPVESIGSLGRHVFQPDLNVIYWAEVPALPRGISVQE